METYSAESVLENNYSVDVVLQNDFSAETLQIPVLIDMTTELVKEGITAFAGGGQTDATVLSAKFNKVDVVESAGDSVKCDAAVKGRVREVSNAGDNDMELFPAIGERFEDDTAEMDVDVSLTVAVGNTIRLVCYSSGKWRF